jgi:hypothetical protein
MAKFKTRFQDVKFKFPRKKIVLQNKSEAKYVKSKFGAKTFSKTTIRAVD